MNLQQVKGTAEDIGDGGEDITSESLTKYEKACLDLGVALKEVKNGVTVLRDPMQILEELASAVAKESEDSIKVANLINAVGGKYRGGQLSALLQNWDTYKKMLEEYNSSEAENSALEEAMKSANSWEGKLNKISNSFSELVNNFVDTDSVKEFLDLVNNIINGTDTLIKNFGSLGTVLTALFTIVSAKSDFKIFKTITDDIDDGRTKLTIFNKQLSEIKADWNNGSGLGKIRSAFSSKLTSDDIASLKQYNQLLKDGVSASDAQTIALSNCTTAAKRMASSAKGTAVNLKDVTTSSSGAVVSLNLLKGVLNAVVSVVSIGISLAISKLVTYFMDMANAEEKAKEQIENFNSALATSVDSFKTQSQSLEDLRTDYLELISTTSDLSTIQTELKSIQDSLTESFTNNANSIDVVNGKLSEQIQKYDELAKSQAKQWLNELSDVEDNNGNKVTNESAGKLAQVMINTEEGLDSIFGSYTDSAAAIVMQYSGVADKYSQLWEEISGGDYKGTPQERLDWLTQVYDELSEQWKDVEFSTNDPRSNFLTTLQSEISTLTTNINLWETAVKSLDDAYATLQGSEMSKEMQKTIDEFDVVKNDYLTALENKDVEGIDTGLEKIQEYRTVLMEMAGDNETVKESVITLFDSIPTAFSTETFDISNYTDKIDEILERNQKLQKFLSDLSDGSLTQSDLIEYFEDFPELMEYADDTEVLKRKIKELINTDPSELIENLQELRKNLTDESQIKSVDNLTKSLKKLCKTATELENINEVLDGMKDSLENILSYYETTADVISDYCDDMQEYWENQKDSSETYWDNLIESEETYWNNQINALETEKNALQDKQDEIEKTNDLLEKQKAIREAQIALENAQNNKTVIAYTETYGFRLEANQSDVKNAQEDLDEANKALEETIRSHEIEDIENTIGDLTEQKENAVESLEKQKDQALQFFEEEIKGWENYAKQWTETVNAYEKDTNRKIASQILGTDWEVQLSNKSQTALINFANGYSQYQNKLEDVNNQIAQVEGEIYAKRGEEVDTYISKLEQLEQTYNRIISAGNSVGAVIGGNVGGMISRLTANAATSASLGLATASINASSNYSGMLSGIREKLNNINQNLTQPSTSNYELNLNGNIISDNPDKFANFLSGVITKMKNKN